MLEDRFDMIVFLDILNKGFSVVHYIHGNIGVGFENI